MRAILYSEANKAMIAEYDVIPKDQISSLDIYLRHHEDWYLVSGYVSPWGHFEPWAILPAAILPVNFEFDADKIKTDWTNLVRKADAP